MLQLYLTVVPSTVKIRFYTRKIEFWTKHENSSTLKARFKNVAPIWNCWTTWIESTNNPWFRTTIKFVCPLRFQKPVISAGNKPIRNQRWNECEARLNCELSGTIKGHLLTKPLDKYIIQKNSYLSVALLCRVCYQWTMIFSCLQSLKFLW